MRKISDYVFRGSWQEDVLGMTPADYYLVRMDMGDLKKDDLVKFIGFDDVDNHYGIFVFTDSGGKILEVSGDFSSRDHPSCKKLKDALQKAPRPL